MIIKCDWCDKEFNRNPSEIRNNSFCSRKCVGKWKSVCHSGSGNPSWKGGKAKMNCDWCGVKFERFKCLVNKNNNNFCSNNCYGEWKSRNHIGENSGHWQGGRINIICDICGKVFKVDSYRKKVARFCSRECQGEWLSINNVGENHPSWRGGTEDYYGPNWQKQREKALERDGHMCQVCGVNENGEEHSVHHIIPFRNFGLERYEEANKLNNLITLCRSHHRIKEGEGLWAVS